MGARTPSSAAVAVAQASSLRPSSTAEPREARDDAAVPPSPPGRGAGGEGSILALILVSAAVLRLLGLTWGLPDSTHLFSYQPDEFFSLQAALGLLHGDPNPHFFNYPSLYLYLAAAACMIGHGASAPGMAPEALLRAFTLDARLVTVVLALVTVFAAYGAAKRLGGGRAGLLAALIVAVAPGHVLYSHFAAVDVPLACFMALAAWAGLVLYDNPSWKAVALAGLACGAAAATKYNGALVLVVPLLSLALGTRQAPAPRPWRDALLRAAAVVLIAALAFALLSPYVFLDWGKASHDIAFETRHMREGEYPAKAADPSGWWFQALALDTGLGGDLPLVGFAFALVVATRRAWPRSLPVLLAALLWFAMVGATGVRYARYGLPLIPLLAIAASVLKSSAPDKRQRGHWVEHLASLAVLGALTTSVPIALSLALVREPRDAALDYIRRTVPAQESVAVGRTVWFDMPPLDFNNGGDTLGRMFAEFRRPVRPLEVIPSFDSARLRQERPTWFVDTDFQTADWLRAQDVAALAFRNRLETDYVCVTFRRTPNVWWMALSQEVVPHDFSYPFTTIRVWRLKPSEDTPAPPGNGTP